MKKRLQLLISTALLFSVATFGQNASVSFDGNDFIEVPEISEVLGSAARTVEAWIQAPFETNSEQVLVQWGVDDAGTKWTIRLNAGSVLRVEHGAGATFGSTALNDGAWHHVVVALAENAPLSEAKLYVDGVEETYGQQAGDACNTGSHVVYIGKANTKVSDGDKPIPVRHWKGLIDELRIWSAALTLEEIVAMKDSSICPEDHPNLVAYYTFNEGEGIDAVDKTGNYSGIFGGVADSTDLMPTWDAAGAPVSAADCEEVSAAVYEANESPFYPNPVKNQINFLPDLELRQLFIYDVTGKQIIHISDLQNRMVDVSELKQGVYFVRLQLKNNKIIATKLIKE